MAIRAPDNMWSKKRRSPKKHQDHNCNHCLGPTSGAILQLESSNFVVNGGWFRFGRLPSEQPVSCLQHNPTTGPDHVFWEITFAFLQGVPKNTNRTKSLPKLSAMGLNFTIDMTWGRLILLSLSKKRPKNQSPDTRGTGKWWLSQCTVAPAAFWKRVFFGDTLYM